MKILSPAKINLFLQVTQFYIGSQLVCARSNAAIDRCQVCIMPMCATASTDVFTCDDGICFFYNNGKGICGFDVQPGFKAELSWQLVMDESGIDLFTVDHKLSVQVIAIINLS